MDLGILLHQPDYSKSYEVCMRHWDVCKPRLKHTLIIAHHLWVKSMYVVGFQFPCNIPGVRGSSFMHCIVMKIQHLVYSVIIYMPFIPTRHLH